MKKLFIAAALSLVAVPASAQIMYHLTAQWVEQGQRFCRYSNGTVLNVGVAFCPFSIQGRPW